MSEVEIVKGILSSIRKDFDLDDATYLEYTEYLMNCLKYERLLEQEHVKGAAK